MNILSVIGYILSFLIAVFHIYFLVLEMFLWRAKAAKIFRMKQDLVNQTAVLASNQGLYNGFLSAGLLFGILTQNLSTTLFFLGCVLSAGLFGALTASFRILYIQAIPALLASVFIIISMDNSQTGLVSLIISAVISLGLGYAVQQREKQATTL